MDGDVIERASGAVLTIPAGYTTPILGVGTADGQWAITGPGESFDGGGNIVARAAAHAMRIIGRPPASIV